MIVPENKIVYLVTGWLAELELFGKLYNGLVFFAEFIVYAFCKPVVPAPAISELKGPSRMHTAEKFLQKTAGKNRLEHSVPPVSLCKGVSMGQTEIFPAQPDHGRLPAFHYESKFLLKISVCPDIMVSVEKVHLHAGICQSGQCPQRSGISARDDIFIFIPEIEYVAQKINGLCIFGNLLQKGGKNLFAGLKVAISEPQMRIRNKII